MFLNKTIDMRSIMIESEVLPKSQGATDLAAGEQRSETVERETATVGDIQQRV